MSRLIIHIGAPKTGTTAIQSHLYRNQDALRNQSVNYTVTQRNHIAHNILPRVIRKGSGPAYFEDLVNEIQQSPADSHIISSEMLFNPEIARRMCQLAADHLPQDILKNTKIICYLRRHDQFLESLYKQFVKRGKIPADPPEFLEQQLSKLSYQRVLSTYGDVFGQDNVVIRPFDRAKLEGGDVVQDFFSCLGLPKSGSDPAAESGEINPTLSAEISEQIGYMALHAGFNPRELIRAVIALGDQNAFRKNDVFDGDDQRRIAAHFAEDEAALCAWTGSTATQFFDHDDLDCKVTPPISLLEQHNRWARASEIVAKAVCICLKRSDA
ncbi:hypothetical protein BCF46_1061 [Litoreibacter meonggei]|uniref:Sulfotransferase family protein n=1 Tax=Litoreibacter meonggei TaxID=1049199 RepID=A0A497X3B9_9RHOB|nr:hypothetical protein [Litoreibacter meonggei]RLJ58923.1 hypothetical protein BCF46_1061 [Litoreibacter meonggei]